MIDGTGCAAFRRRVDPPVYGSPPHKRGDDVDTSARPCLVAAAAIAAASCAPSFTTVRSEGSRLLACADVNVVWVRDLDYDAKGCGRIVSMRCDKAACRGLPPPPLSPDEMPDAPVFATKNAPPPSCVAMGAAEGNDDTWGTPHTQSRSIDCAGSRTTVAPTTSCSMIRFAIEGPTVSSSEVGCSSARRKRRRSGHPRMSLEIEEASVRRAVIRRSENAGDD